MEDYKQKIDSILERNYYDLLEIESLTERLRRLNDLDAWYTSIYRTYDNERGWYLRKKWNTLYYKLIKKIAEETSSNMK